MESIIFPSTISSSVEIALLAYRKLLYGRVILFSL